VRLYPRAMKPNEAARLLAALTQTLDWRQETLTIMGRKVQAPRVTAWYGEHGYRYSGLDHPARPLPACLAPARQLAERLAGQPFNSVLANLYRDGQDSMGWHADNERSLGPAPVIASLSLGAMRRFQLKHRTEPGLRLALDLPPGSCLVMAGPIQQLWLHQLPKTTRPIGPRLNLTFRRILPA
jgi:alkylated DNA repair dioxygenase AlkB